MVFCILETYVLPLKSLHRWAAVKFYFTKKSLLLGLMRGALLAAGTQLPRSTPNFSLILSMVEGEGVDQIDYEKIAYCTINIIEE